MKRRKIEVDLIESLLEGDNFKYKTPVLTLDINKEDIINNITRGIDDDMKDLLQILMLFYMKYGRDFTIKLVKKYLPEVKI